VSAKRRCAQGRRGRAQARSKVEDAAAAAAPAAEACRGRGPQRPWRCPARKPADRDREAPRGDKAAKPKGKARDEVRRAGKLTLNQALKVAKAVDSAPWPR
jgi:translation initiation factor IF-2